MPDTKPLVEDPDARRWATEFLEDVKGKELSQGWMVSWFANAIMCGHDWAMRKRLNPHPKEEE